MKLVAKKFCSSVIPTIGVKTRCLSRLCKHKALLTSSRRSSGRLTLVVPSRQSSMIRAPFPSPHGPSSKGSVSMWSRESILLFPAPEQQQQNPEHTHQYQSSQTSYAPHWQHLRGHIWWSSCLNANHTINPRDTTRGKHKRMFNCSTHCANGGMLFQWARNTNKHSWSPHTASYVQKLPHTERSITIKWLHSSFWRVFDMQTSLIRKPKHWN